MTFEIKKLMFRTSNEQDWYEIVVEGCVNPRWFDWLDGGEINFLPNGTTLLACWVRDQSALHGILAQIRDLNLKILSLRIRS